MRCRNLGFALRFALRFALVWAFASLASCSSSKPSGYQRSGRANPPRQPPPECALGRLVGADQICGLGIAGRAYQWDDPKMRDLAYNRAATNLAGMLSTMVSDAIIVIESTHDLDITTEKTLEVNDALINWVKQKTEPEYWYDVEGEGPFLAYERTYACACMSPSAASMRIDMEQAKQHVLGKQYPVDEAPGWLAETGNRNGAAMCALGYNAPTFHPEEAYEPLVDDVRSQLYRSVSTAVLSGFEERSVCSGVSEVECKQVQEQVLAAANDGVSKGVAVTAIWYDTQGLGPQQKKRSVYGWGCVFSESIIKRAKEALRDIKILSRQQKAALYSGIAKASR